MYYLLEGADQSASIFYKSEYIPDGIDYLELEVLPVKDTSDDILSATLMVDVSAGKAWYEYTYRSEEQAKREKEIDAAVVAKIREKYDENEEMKMLRLGISEPGNEEFTAYNAYAEECRAWGRIEKTKILEGATGNEAND